MSKTSTSVKDRYNETTYARYTLRVRKDSDLYEDIEAFMSSKGTSLNYLVEILLKDFFFQRNNDSSNI